MKLWNLRSPSVMTIFQHFSPEHFLKWSDLSCSEILLEFQFTVQNACCSTSQSQQFKAETEIEVEISLNVFYFITFDSEISFVIFIAGAITDTLIDSSLWKNKLEFERHSILLRTLLEKNSFSEGVVDFDNVKFYRFSNRTICVGLPSISNSLDSHWLFGAFRQAQIVPCQIIITTFHFQNIDTNWICYGRWVQNSLQCYLFFSGISSCCILIVESWQRYLVHCVCQYLFNA